jgi:hypothetical protein
MMKVEPSDERVEFIRTLQEMPTVDLTVYLCSAENRCASDAPEARARSIQPRASSNSALTWCAQASAAWVMKFSLSCRSARAQVTAAAPSCTTSA